MSALDNLAPDQRAVLQMVLQRGRSYDEIAALLSIERAAVRQRALDAFDALTPASVLPGPERALVTDYLLRQLPERVAEQVHAFLLASEIDREWAQALADVVGPLTSASLPEIPVGAPLGAAPEPAGGLGHGSDPSEPDRAPTPAEEIADAAAEWPREAWSEPSARTPPAREQPPASEPRPGREPRPPREPRPSSRRGGAILLGAIGALIVAVILVVVLTSGGAAKKPPAPSGNTATGSATTQTQSTTGTTATTATTPTARPLAQLNLTSPTGAKSTLGVVLVERVGGVTGMVIDAQGIPGNTKHNAYAVWLYNSATSFKFVGFVQYLVGKAHTINTEGKLPAGATRYHRLLITLETQAHPSTPGEVVLSGPFREHS
jgi:hypothetical protein